MRPDRIETATRLLAEAHGTAQLAGQPAPPGGMEDAFAIRCRKAALLGPVGGCKHGLPGDKERTCAPILAASVLPDGAALSLRPNLRVEVETIAFLNFLAAWAEAMGSP
ncbi:hypothetical protein [Solirhodobacter olei]|uniref:hypothetical protein n=1 Tax=Solirhodobacter olei TaxID=2493082 RepID=UPI000FDC276A|nr:hypothetical protein [Solirhodobacter olei]